MVVRTWPGHNLADLARLTSRAASACEPAFPPTLHCPGARETSPLPWPDLVRRCGLRRAPSAPLGTPGARRRVAEVNGPRPWRTSAPRPRLGAASPSTRGASPWRAVIRKLDLAPVHLAGLSMGGFVAMRIAAREPGLLRTLMLLNTAASAEARAKVPRYLLLSAVGRIAGVSLSLLASRVEDEM
ncbi:MAG: alpha/beta fold hydrolase [Micromonosporaceae bacterium]